jgi:hypothetical protein
LYSGRGAAGQLLLLLLLCCELLLLLLVNLERSHIGNDSGRSRGATRNCSSSHTGNLVKK